jgi:hypothetical protein
MGVGFSPLTDEEYAIWQFQLEVWIYPSLFFNYHWLTPNITLLIANRFGITQNQSRHKLGRDRPAPLNQKIP